MNMNSYHYKTDDGQSDDTYFYDNAEIHHSRKDEINIIKESSSYKKYKRLEKLERILDGES